MLKGFSDALAFVARDSRQRLVALCVAVSLTLAGVTRSFLEMSSGGVGSFPMPGDNLLMVALCALVGFAGCRFHRGLARFFLNPAGRLLVPLFALVSAAAVCACRFLGEEAGSTLFFYAGVAVRIASLLCLLAVYARVSPRDVGACAAQTVWGIAVAVVFDCVFLLLAPAGVTFLGLLFPVVFWVCLVAFDRIEAEHARGSEEDAGAAVPGESGRDASSPAPFAQGGGPEASEADTARIGLPWLRLLTFALYGVVGGLSSSQAHSLSREFTEQPTMVHSCLVNDAGLLAGAAILLVGVIWLSRRNVEAFTLRYLLLPAYLVCIFLSPLLAGFMGVVVPILMAVSQALFYGLLWVFPRPAPQGDHLRWYASCCGFFFTGTYLGMFVGGDFLPSAGAGDAYMVIAAVALAALLMLEFAPRFSSVNPDMARDVPGAPLPQGAPGAGPAVAPAPEVDPGLEAGAAIDALAARAADAWGLTPRERAVLPGLLRGRSVAWVAESLTLSKNTVHTHMRNIYQKAGVHSQGELIDAAEALGPKQ